MYCEGTKNRDWWLSGKADGGYISYDKGVVICKAYDKLDGRYFANFILTRSLKACLALQIKA
jgi:hypothetical protein